jgi:hypothetical protein
MGDIKKLKLLLEKNLQVTQQYSAVIKSLADSIGCSPQLLRLALEQIHAGTLWDASSDTTFEFNVENHTVEGRVNHN